MRKPHQRTRKHDGKGRSITSGQFVNLPYWMLESPAWCSLNPASCRLYLAIARRYNGFNNGQIGLSCRDAAKECYIGKNTAQRAFTALEERGFIKRRFQGSFSQKKSLASEWELTILEMGNNPAAKDFMAWKPGHKI